MQAINYHNLAKYRDCATQEQMHDIHSKHYGGCATCGYSKTNCNGKHENIKELFACGECSVLFTCEKCGKYILTPLCSECSQNE